MQAETLEFDAIRYNPELQGFEAEIRIRDGAETLSYPAFIRAPLTADYALVARGLTQKALALHKGHGKGQRLRLRTYENGHSAAMAA
ncbi:hypothetical protein [Roseovarius aestuariivivens]|uniref:hypothetical protein n=1 Tax=Roseovarius aestuariivivens TaxID=1888910 RepID=UPI001080829F|nr:hypothetical protein [Roseovarius aestuariivivens]